jgi:oligoribonuclease NrnB/cAMP/cGMP phosphodiesterase (DHH superfamily)
VILVHHKSAAEDLTGFRDIAPFDQWDDDVLDIVAESAPSIGVLFDMNRSGAGITWDFFHDATRPPLIDHIEDRDLWRFALEGTRQIQAVVFSYPYDFDVWDGLMACDLESLRREGEAIERKHFKDIDELLDVTMRYMVIGGHRVPVANLPYTLTSDAGHQMAEGNPFAACYWDTPEGRVFSLRSSDDGLDVSDIAKQYGGGGHTHAAGFSVAIGWEGEAA